MRALLLSIALLTTSTPAFAQDAAPVAPAAAPAPVPSEYVYVALTVPQGVITLALDKIHAPLTTANFLKYVDTKKMDGAVFYRAMRWVATSARPRCCTCSARSCWPSLTSGCCRAACWSRCCAIAPCG